MDQHLFAEFREIKMVPKSLRRSLVAARARCGYAGALAAVLAMVPKQYTLNKGHVSFFYNKGAYLHARYAALRAELDRRGINYNPDSLLDPDCVFDALPPDFNQQYTPDEQALAVIRQRIKEKIAMKPDWYRYTG